LKGKLHYVTPPALILLACEVLVSYMFWSGTPDDAVTSWYFSFLYLELAASPFGCRAFRVQR